MSDFYSQAWLANKREQLRRTHLSIGWHPTTGDEFLVSEEDRKTAMYVPGLTGHGKTGFFRTMIHKDALNGNAIIVLDPNHDLVMDVIAELPKERIPQTYLLNMRDEDWPFGVNVFAVGKLQSRDQRTQAVERLVHTFQVIFPKSTEQQNLPLYLRTSAIAMIANPGKTMVHMLRFLSRKDFRDTMLRSVTDQETHEFWQDHDALSPSDQETRVRPLVTRLRSLFMGRDLVRNILAQSGNSISFRRAIENHEIILIDLPLHELGEDAQLIGTLLMAQIYSAIFSFADLPPDKRPGVSLYVDEFQNFATKDFATLFAEARKFSARVVVAHQERSQLADYLIGPTKSIPVKVCFRLNAENAKEMAQYYPDSEPEVRPEDIDAQVTDTLLVRASDYGFEAERFVDAFLQPLQKYRRSRGKVEIAHPGFDGLSMAAGFIGGQPAENLMEADPTYYLDRLLYDVMRTGNWQLPIPWQIVRGLSNSGSGFFAAARGVQAWELSSEMMQRFPLHLVKHTGDGDMEWARPPSTGKEWLYFCIFCLRSLMHRLAKHPIGKESVSSSADVARILTSLPKRAALVRAGNHSGVIYTHDTPTPAGEIERELRLQAVVQQSRAKYCHKREDVEQALLAQYNAESGKSEPKPTPEGEVLYKKWQEVDDD